MSKNKITFKWTADRQYLDFFIGGNIFFDFTVDWGDGKGVEYYHSKVIDSNSFALPGLGFEIEYDYDAYGEYQVTIQTSEKCDMLYFSISKAPDPLWINLDLSEAPDLQILDMWYLKGLDVTKNQKLKILKCFDSDLGVLDLGQNPNLERLVLNFNRLTKLISKCNTLKYLDCSFCLLTELDVSQSPALETLDCGNNNIIALDLNKNTKLTNLDCANYDYMFSPVNNQLTLLDLTKNKALKSLSCNNNQIKELDLSKNPLLKYLDCVENPLTSLKLNPKTLKKLGKENVDSGAG